MRVELSQILERFKRRLEPAVLPRFSIPDTLEAQQFRLDRAALLLKQYVASGYSQRGKQVFCNRVRQLFTGEFNLRTRISNLDNVINIVEAYDDKGPTNTSHDTAETDRRLRELFVPPQQRRV